MATLIDRDLHGIQPPNAARRAPGAVTASVPTTETAANDLVDIDQWDPNSGNGVRLPVDAEPEARLLNAPVIAIDFPTFFDGRGLSLAVLLRQRFGFRNELRAVGQVHPDLLHYMHRCGFDTFVLPDDYDADRACRLLAPYSDHYQGSVRAPEPPYRRLLRGA